MAWATISSAKLNRTFTNSRWKGVGVARHPTVHARRFLAQLTPPDTHM